jgi:response regulator RpfG family c-di-GMP phosphodiesterase
MKLIRSKTSSEPSPPQRPANKARHTWKLLVIDDEPDVRELTRLNLKGFQFDGRGLDILEAASAHEAKQILAAHHDIAVALIDVVMESDDAGLKLVEHIRDELKNLFLRLIIRTGQPGLAPERYVIDHYDIDDYKDKTELTASHLYTTVRSAIKAYRDLRIIDLNRTGLARVLEAVPDIYQISSASLSLFFQGVLTQIVGLCNLDESSFISTINGLIATVDGNEVTVQAATNAFWQTPRFEEISTLCQESLLTGTLPAQLRQNAFVIPLNVQHHPAGFIYIEPISELSEADCHLIRLLAQQTAGALENLRLHLDLQASYNHVVDMLAAVAEFKDKTTGEHIGRIDQYTRIVAMAMGIDPEEAARYGKASRMHDVGKIGIPDDILNKPGPLTEREFALVRTHPLIGASILSHDKALALAHDIALYHHERWDGTGYPTGRPLRELPLVIRIVSVVDTFDALVSGRPYKQPWPLEQARETIAEGAGTQFDPDVVAAFLGVLDRGEFDEVMASAGRHRKTAAPGSWPSGP